MNEEVNATWGNIGKDIVPSSVYQVYRVEKTWANDDEGMWYEFDSENNSTISLEPTYPNYEFNKYGKTKNMEEVTVTITADSTLSSEYPQALVSIDGKYYDLKYIKNPVKLYMNKSHRISIEWAPGLTETFRIIKL